MAVYRSDQALVTFGTEAAPGGYPELAYAAVSGVDTTLDGVHTAGSRSILVTAAGAFAIGDYLVIGHTVVSVTGQYNSEIRRIVALDTNRLYLDVPTGFHHIDNVDVREVNTGAASVIDASFARDRSGSAPVNYSDAMRFVPGIYDTVEVGDQTTTYNPVYALGATAKRSPTFIYRGEQAFTGAISGMTLLNGWPLRYGIGKVTTTPTPPTHEGSAGTNVYDDAVTEISWYKGDQIIQLPDDDYSGDSYAALVLEHATPESNRDLIWINHSGSEEMVQVYKLADAGNKRVILSAPLRFDHISSATNPVTVVVMNYDATRYYTHTISETADLDSIAMNVHMRDSGETTANDFNRRYYGGHIGTSVIAAEEQGLVTTSWDGIQFMGMVHNQGKDSSWSEGTGAALFLPRHEFTKTISDTEAWVPSAASSTHAAQHKPLGYPTQPYYFSQGNITLYGVPIATVRSFNLTINNNPEARYYIGGKSGNRFRGPYEIVNQRRDYAMTMTVVEPTSRATTESGASTAGYEQGSQSVFKQMLMEGDVGGLESMTPEGLSFEIQFSRDDLTTASKDYIKITPSYATGSSPAFGLSTQGMFISSAKYNLDGSSPIQADLEIILRNVEIEIVDKTAVYP